MRLRTAPVLALAACLAACTVQIGGHVETCGEIPDGGGAPVIATKDQELCELVRLRVAQALEKDPDLTYGRVQELLDKTSEWEGKRTLESLVAALRKDCGNVTADAVQRAVDDVTSRSTRPTRKDCDDVQRCLVKGAAKGVRMALSAARPWGPETPTAPAPAPAPDK